MQLPTFLRSKKFRYGSVSTVFTILFVAIIIVINVITTALAQKFMWYIDMTNEQVFSLSDDIKTMLADVDTPTTIYFCMEPDQLEANGSMKYIYTTAKQLAAEFDNIEVVCKDVIDNYAFFKRFQTSSSTQILTTSVIVESGSEFRLFAYQAFFTYSELDYSVFAYNGEAKFASAILQTTAESMPIVVFTTTHGEDVGMTSSLYAQMSEYTQNNKGTSTNAALEEAYLDAVDADQLLKQFDLAGYEVRFVDLTNEDIPEGTRFVVINDPMYDFLGADAEDESKNEIRKVDEFLDDFGTLLVFEDPTYSDNLVNLNEFLNEWGISFRHGTVVEDPGHAISTDARSIVAAYTSGTLAASLYNDISSLATMPRTIIRNVMPIDLTYETRTVGNGSRDTSAILQSYDTALLKNGSETVDEGVFNLMTLTRETRIIDNEYYYSYVIACGSTGYATESYLQSNTYANSDILYSAMRAMGKEKIPAAIDFKVFQSYDLDITTAEANQWTVTLVVALPAVIAILGIIVFIKRKNT